MDGLKLMALDASDLTVISAQMQDAITKPDLIDYAPAARRFTIVANRFAWDAEKGGGSATHERRKTALSFARVTGVRTIGIRRGDDSQALSLLAIRFHPGEAPAGTIELIFADDAAIRLDVEVIEAQMADLGAAWETRFKPRHPAG
jgi:hypothetical protein